MVRLKKLSLGNKILYEVAIGIVAVILLLGVLNTVTHTEKIPLVTTEDLEDATITIRYAYWDANGTTIRTDTVTYNASDIITLYDNYVYLTIPYDDNPPEGTVYNTVCDIRIYLQMTWKDLIEKGINSYDVYFEAIDMPVNDKNIYVSLAYPSFYGMYGPLYFGKFNSSGPLDVNGTIDTGSLLIKTISIQNEDVVLYINPMDTPSLDGWAGIKFKLDLYATSEKPLLKMFTEPAYGIIAGLWSTLVAVYHRIRQYALSFFGGFSVSALFTGLIGDPTTALIITAAVIAIFFFALTRPAPRRRHD